MLQIAFWPSCMNRASVFEWHKRFKESRESPRDDKRCGRSKEVNTPELIGQRVRVRVIMLRFWWSSERDFLGRGQHSSNRVSGIPSPQLHPCHKLFDQDRHQDSSPSSLSSRPCFQWLLVIPEAQRLSLWDNWGDERGCDEGHWHADIRGLPWGLPEVVGTVQQEHCRRRRLLGRGLEFHVCTINKSAQTKKVWKRKKSGSSYALLIKIYM